MKHFWQSKVTRAMAAVAAAAFLSASNAQAAESVAVRLSFTPFAVHIPIYVAKALGYYEKNGLNVDIRPGRGSAFAAMTVGSAQEEFGVADAAAVVTARAKDVPVVVLANFQQDNGAALFATEKSGIGKVEDLKGKNVGLFTGSTTTIFMQALLKKHGMSLSDVSPVTVRSGTDLPLVLDGKIDAEVTIYSNELVAWSLEHPELKLKIWRMQQLGFDTPGNSLVTNEALVKNKPEVVRGFTAATVQGMDYALKNPDKAVEILVKAVPELKMNVEMAKWRSYMDSITSVETQNRGLGALDAPKWKTLVDLLKEYGGLQTNVDLSALLQDKYRTLN
jgi:NitT/TauT family transport system substrate-binding protein